MNLDMDFPLSEDRDVQIRERTEGIGAAVGSAATRSDRGAMIAESIMAILSDDRLGLARGPTRPVADPGSRWPPG
jgi:hypothetical protein